MHLMDSHINIKNNQKDAHESSQSPHPDMIELNYAKIVGLQEFLDVRFRLLTM